MARVQVRPASSLQEVRAAYEVAARVFGPSYEDARTIKDRILSDVEPVRHPSEVIVASDGADVVGLVRLVTRRLRIGSMHLAVSGMTSVAVRSSYRGRYLGERLMRTSLRQARLTGADVAVLFARRAVDGWYQRFGFVGLGQHAAVRIEPERVHREAIPTEVRGLTAGWRERALPAYRRAYVATYGMLPGRFDRPARFWNAMTARLALRPALTWLHARHARADIGYALLDGDRIVEAAAVKGAAHTLTRLLLQRAGGRELLLALHPRHSLVAGCAYLNHTASARVVWDGGHMLAPLSRRSVTAFRNAGIDVRRPWEGGRSCDLPVWSPLDEF